MQPEHWQEPDENGRIEPWIPPAEPVATVPSFPSVNTLPPPPTAVANQAIPPSAPQLGNQPLPKDDDVTARLAALKAKLAAKGAATKPLTTPSQPPPVVSSQPALAAPAKIDASSQRLQEQLENERRNFTFQLERARMDATHQAAQVEALRSALAEAERAATAAATASSIMREKAEEYEDNALAAEAVLRVQAQAAREKAMADQSRVGALEAQMADLQAQLERSEAALIAGSSNSNIHAELENELATAKRESTALRDELERVRAQALTTAAAAAAAAADSSFGSSEGVSDSKHLEEIEVLRGELAALRDALSIAEAERGAAKLQLSRLKNQMLTEQEDEEETIHWRVEAEVKLALEKMGVGSNGGDTSHESALQAEINNLTERAERAEEEAARWEQTASARDVELANLQRALGEMSYESDIAVQLRGELRAMQADVHRLRNELDAARVSTLAADNAVQQAQLERDAARQDANVARDAEAEAQREVLAARVAAQEAVRELQELRKNGGTLDRGLVLQTLSGMMRFRRPGAALDFVASSLGLRPEEVEEVKVAARKGGLTDNAAGGPSLASSWINFLEAAVNEEVSVTPMVAAAPTPAKE